MNKILNIKKEYMSNPSKVLTLANTISMLRAAAAIPIIYTLNYPEMRAITAGIVILAILSDALEELMKLSTESKDVEALYSFIASSERGIIR